MRADIDRFALALAQSWENNVQVVADPASQPGTAEDAYRIQDQVYAARYPGVAARAWKVGAADVHAEPNGAPIGLLLESPAKVDRAAFHMFGIEAEIAFRLVKDLPPRARAWQGAELAEAELVEAELVEAELVEAIGEALVTIELCDTRMVDWKSASPLTKLADFQLNGALVVGSGVTRWQGIDFSAQRVELWVNGLQTVDAKGTHSLGNPLRLMPWAAAHCARRAGGLRAGDLVTTGSWTGMRFASPGDTLIARFPGIGEASLQIL